MASVGTFVFRLVRLAKLHPDKEIGELLAAITYRAEGHTDPSAMTTEAAIEAVEAELKGEPI